VVELWYGEGIVLFFERHRPGIWVNH
jgi:hypothetical protein